MKFLIALTLLVVFTVLSTQAQQLLYPAKYHAYKVVLSRGASLNSEFKPVKTWTLDLLIKTSRTGVRIYNTTNTGYSLAAVGAPAYQLTNLGEMPRSNDDGIVTETYIFARYVGQISPPSKEIDDPESPNTVTWRSAVSGNKSLNIFWSPSAATSDELRNAKGPAYRLTFYCRPVQ
jgi:hypothetical protein